MGSRIRQQPRTEENKMFGRRSTDNAQEETEAERLAREQAERDEEERKEREQREENERIRRSLEDATTLK